jgi:carboxypeptidase Q
MPAVTARIFGRLIAITVLAAPVVSSQESIDAAANARIRDEGVNRSQVMESFDTFVNVIGPRLTGSAGHRRAAEYARDTLQRWGLSNAHLEPWEFGRGWELDKLTIEMIEPRYMPLIGYAEAFTPSTPGELIVSAVSVAGKTPEEIARLPIAGAAVLQQPTVAAFIDTDREQPTLVPGARIGAPPSPGRGRGAGGAGGARGRGAAAGPSPLAQAAVILKPSLGMHGTVFVQAASRENPDNRTPNVVLAAEHYNIVSRLLERNVAVKLRVNVQTRFLDDRRSYNVLAEIPGVDPVLKDEIVMVGAHLDSWHVATGATDNADGAAQVMEVGRILMAAGLRPKRTIRLALWGGEEQGLLGSARYVEAHLAGETRQGVRDKFSVYFNIDPGTGPIYGWYSENNAPAKALFDTWLAPWKDLGARQNILAGVGNTDHLSFTRAGLAGFTPIQEYADYDVRLHHTNADTAEAVKAEDLKQAAVVLASFVYQAAVSPQRIPR